VEIGEARVLAFGLPPGADALVRLRTVNLNPSLPSFVLPSTLILTAMPKTKAVVKSTAMLQRIASLESRLKGSLVARANKVKLSNTLRTMQKSRKSHGTPVGPNRLKGPRTLGGQKLGHGGSLNLGSTATSRFRQTIEEDEYIAEISGSVGFATTAFNINPGQSGTFPWGNKIAQLYERYDFKFLEFYLCSEVSAYATQGQTGVVILSCDYDASDVAPTTKQQVLDTNPHTVPCLPSVERPVVLRLDCKEMRTSDAKYVRPGAQPVNTDLKTYDAGILYVTTQGNANTTNIGELHVRYRCELKKPVLEAGINQTNGSVHFSSIAPTTANNFAAAVLQAGGTPSMAGGITLGTNVINFAAGLAGNYFIAMSISAATSASAIYLSSTTGVGQNLFTAGAVRDAAYEATSLAGTTTFCAMANVIVQVPAAGCTATMFPATLVTSGTGNMDLFIFALPSTLITKPSFEEKVDRLYAHLSKMHLLDDCDDVIVDTDGSARVVLAPESSSSSAPRANSLLRMLTR
jgi:hypothetical protein